MQYIALQAECVKAPLDVRYLRSDNDPDLTMAILQRPLSVVELYAGTARSAEPFKRWKRCRVNLLVDRDEFASHTYRLNNPRAPYLTHDLAKVSASELKWLAGGSVDILLGCPPCTGFSDTGARNLRAYVNSHLTRFSNFAVALRPMAVAIENVPIAGETGRFEAFVERLERAGYLSTYGILNAALRGSPQCRHRLLYIGIRKDVGEQAVIPPATHGAGRFFSYRLQQMSRLSEDHMAILSEAPGARRVREGMPHKDVIVGRKWIPTIGETISDLPVVGSRNGKRIAHLPWKHSARLIRRMGRVPEGGRWKGGEDHFSHAYGRLHRKGLARTITTFFSNAGSGRFWHPTEDRALSLREAARLQGFDDSFRLIGSSPAASCRLIGNALDGRLAEVAYEAIRQALE